MSVKEKIKSYAYRKGMKIIDRRYPRDNWRNEYTKLRWWFMCSDHYDTRFKEQFRTKLSEYRGTGCSKGWRTRFDYWLSWFFLGAEPEEYFDYEFFRKGMLWKNHHITMHRFNFIFSTFNDADKKKALNDKPSFNQRWSEYIGRKWCVPQDVAYEEFEALFSGLSRIIVKPVASYGGTGIYALDINASNLRSVYDQLHASEDRLIAEEYVFQKGFLNEVSPVSLNPLRVTTVRIEDEVFVLYAFFTAGCHGNIVANDNSGGISFPINIKTGQMGVGQGLTSNNHSKHPDTGVMVAGEYVPDWERIKAFACEAHKLAPEGLGLIGWDICWNDGVLSLIEGNGQPGFPELPDRHEHQWKEMQGYLDRVYKPKA